MKTKLLPPSIYLIVAINMLNFCCISSVKAQSFTKVTIGAIATDSSNSLDPAWADYDNDGDLDLFVCTSGLSATNLLGRNLLFMNNCNGDFSRVTAIPGGIATDYTEPGPYFPPFALFQQAVWVDYDNDDDPDLYVANRSGNNFFYRNNGDGTFTRLADGPGLTNGKSSGSISWADYDNDGYLDLIIGGSVQQTCDLYHNNGDGTFTEITEGDIVNVGTGSWVGGYTSAAWADFNNDGFMDVFITTAWDPIYYRNFLYLNNGNGTFTNDTGNVAVNDPRITWYIVGNNYSSAPADYDNDLDLDLFVQSEYTGDYLYSNNGNGQFTAVTEGPVVNTLGYDNGGNAFGDYDNDGDLDLYVTNWGGQNFFYVNNGDGTFTQNTTEIVANEPEKAESYAAAWADYDNDGNLDLYVANCFGSPSNYLYINIYKNNGNPNHWFKLNCKGVITNRDAIGARVYVKAHIDGKDVWQLREINCNSAKGGGGGGAVSGQVCHFGIGDAEIIDTLKIVWPTSGITQVFTNLEADRFIRVFEDDNTVYPVRSCTPDLPPKNPGFITGNVQNDVDSNCVFNPVIDYPLSNRMIQAMPGPYAVFSDNNGNYELRVPEGNYSVEQAYVTNDIFKQLPCPGTDTAYSVSVSAGSTATLDRFVDVIKTKDPNVIIILSIAAGETAPCPGQTYHVCASFNNLGSAVSGADFTIDITPLVGLTLSNATSIDCNCTPVISGQTVTCSPPSFPANKNCIICFDVFVPNNLALYGQDLTTVASISNSYYNETTSINTIDCSFDPNDKLVAPKGCGPNRNIGRGEPLTYSIRFQNTGTAPAHNIVLKDVLDNDLDFTSLRIIASTHTITRLEIIPDNSLIISYEGIELPDSSSNPEGSIGSVVFSILPKNNIPDSTTIINQAGIYFDYNEVVLTNTTLNTIRDNPYPVADFSANHSCTNTGFVYDFTYTGNTANNASFLWDFGSDATPSSSTAQNPSGIIFNSTGTKQVLLTVTCFGCVSSITKPVEIINVHCGNNNQKILVCHIPSGNPNNPQTICISPIALPAHLAHGDCVGPCASNLKMLKINNDTANESIQFYIYPNPSDNISTIIFSTPFDDFVTIDIYNYMGVFVKNVYKNITNGNKEYKLQFNIKTLSNGVYYCILKTNFEQKIIKLVILRGLL